MIVSDKHKFVYMNIGKTGSISLGRLFEQDYEGFVWKDWHDTARRPQCAPQHICHLPAQLANFLVITSVRNPFTHEISRYTHRAPEARKDKIDQSGFHKWISRKWMETFCSKLDINQKIPVGCVKYTVDHIIHLETIEEDFNKLPFVDKAIAVPHNNKTQNDQSKLYYTAELADQVRKKRAIDFETFGYSMDLPKEMRKIKCL